MGVYIKGMKPPKDCRECLQGFAVQIGCNRMKDGKISYHNRREDCPLVEVKIPHGRLIDVDEVEAQAELMQEVNGRDRGFMDIALAFAVAPTVIEAEVE